MKKTFRGNGTERASTRVPPRSFPGTIFLALFAISFFAGFDVSIAAETSVWNTNWNEMTLHQEGAVITGTYAHDDGEIAGTLEGGTLFGWWRETGNAKTCGLDDAWSGALAFRFSSDGTSFQGDWCYCPQDDPHLLDPSRNTWSGTLIQGNLDVSGDAGGSDSGGNSQAYPPNPLVPVDMPTAVNPAANPVTIDACSDITIRPTLQVPAADVGQTATMIMYIYVPKAGFGINIPPSQATLSAVTECNLIPTTIDFRDAGKFTFYVYYGYVLGSKIAYSAYAVTVGDACGNTDFSIEEEIQAGRETTVGNLTETSWNLDIPGNAFGEDGTLSMRVLSEDEAKNYQGDGFELYGTPMEIKMEGKENIRLGEPVLLTSVHPETITD